MEVVIEEVNSASRRMKFVLPGTDVGQEVNQIAKKMTKTVSVPGFRKGKVPLTVVKRKFYDQIKNDAIMALVGGRVEDELKEREIEPFSQPYIEDYTVDDETEDYQITVFYEVLPEFDDPTLAGEDIVNPVVKLTEDDVDTVIERWQKTHQAFETIDEPATQNDRVLLQIEQFRDGKSAWGEAQAFVLDLDDEKSEIPEVVEACIGKSKGDKFSVYLNLTESEQGGESTELEKTDIGQNSTEYKIEIFFVQRPIADEFTDEFLETLDVSGRKDENFRKRVRERIESMCDNERLECLRNLTSALLLMRNSFSLPESMVINRSNQLMKLSGLTKEVIEEEFKKGVESEFIRTSYFRALVDLKLELMIDRLVATRKIPIEGDDIESYIDEKINNSDLLSEDDSEEARMKKIERLRPSYTFEYVRNKALDAVLLDAEPVEKEMDLEEFENWTQETRRFLDQGPDQDSESDESVAVEADSDSAEEESTSLIVDASGNPIEKSKSV